MNFNDLEIDLSLYKVFYLVCQNGSFSKTAEILGQTQPNISYNIKKLEECLGVTLFERGNVLTLTPEGEALLPYVEEAISALKKGETKVNDIINLKKGQISIGVPSHIGVFLLTDIIKKFNSEYPNIKMKVTCKPTKELFRLLNINELDIVIDCSPLEENINNFKIVKISREKCVFACNRKNRELLEKPISLKTLSTYPLIVPARTSGSTKSLIPIFESQSIIFDPFFEVMTSDMIAEMAEKELGIGFLFEKTVKKYVDLEIINIEETLPVFDIFMIYKDYLLSITTQVFIKFVKEKIKKTI